MRWYPFPPVVVFFTTNYPIKPILETDIVIDDRTKRMISSNSAVSVVVAKYFTEEDSGPCLGTAKPIPPFLYPSSPSSYPYPYLHATQYDQQPGREDEYIRKPEDGEK